VYLDILKLAQQMAQPEQLMAQPEQLLSVQQLVEPPNGSFVSAS
jgi:hypothetical protein